MIALPFASTAVAVSCTVEPSLTLAVGGRTVTVAAGPGVTVMVDVPLLPSLVAVIVALPTSRPVTTPVDETVATASLLDFQVTTRSVTVVPLMSFTVGTRATVDPLAMLTAKGDSETLPTAAGVTVSAVLALLPSLVAVIVAVPVMSDFTTPVAETVATLVLEEAQVTTRSVTTTPLTS